MDLICDENNSFKECKSNFDPVFIEDERVIKNLLSTQSRYTIQFSYFKCVQTNLNVFMREQVANWMLEVSLIFFFFRLCYIRFSIKSLLTFFVYVLFLLSVVRVYVDWSFLDM